MVALETPRSNWSRNVLEPSTSPVSIYFSTICLRTRIFLMSTFFMNSILKEVFQKKLIIFEQRASLSLILLAHHQEWQYISPHQAPPWNPLKLEESYVSPQDIYQVLAVFPDLSGKDISEAGMIQGMTQPRIPLLEEWKDYSLEKQTTKVLQQKKQELTQSRKKQKSKAL